MAHGNGESNLEVAAARREVEVAKAALRARVRDATESSSEVVRHVTRSARPALYLLAGVGALALLAGIYRIARGPARRSGWLAPPKPPSALGRAVRSLSLALAMRLATRVVDKWTLRQLPAPR